jgi:hypothetical protein
MRQIADVGMRIDRNEFVRVGIPKCTHFVTNFIYPRDSIKYKQLHNGDRVERSSDCSIL